MELTLDIVLKIFITAFLGYLTINSFLRFHFSMERITVTFLIAVFVLMVFNLGNTKAYQFLLTLGVFVIFFIILIVYCILKKDLGYVLFNTYGKEYEQVLEDLKLSAQKNGISFNNICYNKNKPFLVVFKNLSIRKTTKIMKDMDLIYTKKPKRFTMYNYWYIAVFLVIMASVWRF